MGNKEKEEKESGLELEVALEILVESRWCGEPLV